MSRIWCLLMGAWLGSVVPAYAAEQWLTPADITYVFVGREVAGVYQNGAPFSEIYRRSGKVEYRDDLSTLTGRWSLKDRQFCTHYDGQPGGCFNIKLVSQNCFEYWLVKPDATVENTWIARSWQKRYPSTCPAFTPAPS